MTDGALRSVIRPASVAASASLGAAVAVVTAACYFVASGRSLDYDSSFTVGVFVKTGSLFDPLRRQVELNNHPLFSMIEHVVWSAGLHTETALRVAPITFGALTVGLLTAWCANRWGVLAGLSAGAVLAANPMFATLSRQVRGYSLLSLCAVASTLLLWHLLESAPESIPPWVPVAYVGFVAAGIATHLYGCAVLLVHAAIVAGGRELGAAWVKRWIIGLALGGLIYLDTIDKVIHTRNERTFHHAFPREAVLALLGQARVCAIALGIVVVCALWLARSHRDVLAGVAAVVLFVVFVWVVVQPQFLVVRYLVWLIPGVALAAAFFVARRPIAIVIVVVGVAAMVAHEWPSWTVTEFPTAETAALVDSARVHGMKVCGLFHTGISVSAYTRQPDRPKNLAELASCDFVMGLYVSPAADALERRAYPYAWMIDAQTPVFIYSRKPRSVLTAGMPRLKDTLDTHPAT